MTKQLTRLLASAAVIFTLAASLQAAPEDFTVVLIPDTQKYTESHPGIYLRQMQWIRDGKEARNIRFAIHLGDIVENNLPEEWEAADEAMSQLDGVVPYSIVPGNHDLDRPGGVFSRIGTLYHKHFPPSRFEGQAWYGGHKDAWNDNNFCYFSGGGKEFLVLSLEFGPPDETLAWASEILQQHRDRHVIVATHCYMYHDDTRLGEGDDYSPHLKYEHWNDGEQMWEKFVRRHSNIFLVVSGHVKGDLTGYRVDKGEHGNTVHQLLANYQTLENGGNGFLRVLRFVPAENKIYITAYSPTLDEYNRAPDHTFAIEVSIWP